MAVAVLTGDGAALGLLEGDGLALGCDVGADPHPVNIIISTAPTAPMLRGHLVMAPPLFAVALDSGATYLSHGAHWANLSSDGLPRPVASGSQDLARALIQCGEIREEVLALGTRFGVLTRYRAHADAFDLTFWEAKGVAGAQSSPPGNAIPTVSAFADNRVAREHPDWVQVGPQGQRGDRSTQYFDWSTLCPTRDAVFELALGWAAQAASSRGLRLDDVSYAREGYCQCPACTQAIAADGGAADAFRTERIAQFVRAVRSVITGKLLLTLYPDPYPGHLPRRFGVDPGRLGDSVDTFVVPIYDLSYSTTYWIETLAQGFRDLLTRPFLIELYGLGVPEERLIKAARVAWAYADGVVIAYEKDLAKLQHVRDAVLG